MLTPLIHTDENNGIEKNVSHQKSKTKALSESNSSSKHAALWFIRTENKIWINLIDQLQEFTPKCKDLLVLSDGY